MANPTVFVERFRADVRVLIAAVNALKADSAEYVALDLGNVIQSSDVPGGTTKAEIIAALTSVQAITDLLAQGHATNLYKVT